MNKNLWLFLLGIGMVAPLPAMAQEDASRIEKRFEKPIEPKSSPQPLVFPIDEKLPPEKAQELRFTLKELVIKGNTAFSAEALTPLYANMLGKEITLMDIYKLRDAITAKYGNAGFGLSKAIIPEQRIEAEGIVQLEIIEGFVDEVVIEGATDVQQAYLSYAIEKIKAERPFKAGTLERYLLLANDRFAIKATSTMKPSEKTPAASTVILQVEQAPKLEGGISFDNRGTYAVGPAQINANFALNGLGKRASQTALNYSTVEQGSELQYFVLSQTEVLSKEGTALTLSLANSESHPGTPALVLLNNKSLSDTFSLQLAHPVIRTRQRNLTAHIKYEYKDVEGKSLGALTLQDKIRSVRFGLNFDNADAADGTNQVLIEYSSGIRDLGASDEANPLRSRADGVFDYQKLTFNLSRKQELAYFSPVLSKLSVNTALMGQNSSNGLLSSEECGVGGQQFGRAYDSSEVTGDICYAASLELRFTPSTEGTSFKYAQLYSFYDGGTSYNITPNVATDSTEQSLSSAGLGVRFGWGKYLSGSIEAAQPLSRDVANEGNKKTRGFASISMRF